ncbi:hypothetical protein M949_0202 [Riemerella anatipestifer CH3]|nr:hypothetical protein M949_0202 [Riemerella anatipestifer CH3]
MAYCIVLWSIRKLINAFHNQTLGDFLDIHFKVILKIV